MKKLLIATALLALATPALAATTAREVIRETGCDSRFSDEKKEDLFKAKYKGQRIVAAGTVAMLKDGQVNLKLLSTTLTFDVRIHMRDERATYDMEKGSKVTIEFTANSNGGCVLSLSGDDGVVVEQ
jgi:hypothetical protein